MPRRYISLDGTTPKAAQAPTLETTRKPANASREGAQRKLLLAAMIEVASEKDYEASRVEDVLARSGLSRATF